MIPRAPQPGGWIQHARCATLTTAAIKLFHSPYAEDQRAAILVCEQCSVRVQCLDHALTHREEHGVWGGQTEADRRRIRRHRRARRAA